MPAKINRFALGFRIEKGCAYIKPSDWDEALRVAVLTMNDPHPSRRGLTEEEKEEAAFLAALGHAGMSVEDFLRNLVVFNK